MPSLEPNPRRVRFVFVTLVVFIVVSLLLDWWRSGGVGVSVGDVVGFVVMAVVLYLGWPLIDAASRER